MTHLTGGSFRRSDLLSYREPLIASDDAAVADVDGGGGGDVDGVDDDDFDCVGAVAVGDGDAAD